MSKVKKMLERALKVGSQKTNIERFCSDVESIIEYWSWNTAEFYKVDEDFQCYIEHCEDLFPNIPYEHNPTVTYLFSLAFQSYVKGEDDAGKIIIAVLAQWDNDYDC